MKWWLLGRLFELMRLLFDSSIGYVVLLVCSVMMYDVIMLGWLRK